MGDRVDFKNLVSVLFGDRVSRFNVRGIFLDVGGGVMGDVRFFFLFYKIRDEWSRNLFSLLKFNEIFD